MLSCIFTSLTPSDGGYVVSQALEVEGNGSGSELLQRQLMDAREKLADSERTLQSKQEVWL